MPASLQKPHLLINFQIPSSSVYCIKIKHYHLLSHQVTYRTGMNMNWCHIFCLRHIKLRLT